MSRAGDKSNRPVVRVNCWEDNFASPNERIVEFTDRRTKARGLISLRQVDGRLEVVLSDLTPNVDVFVPPGHNIN